MNLTRRSSLQIFAIISFIFTWFYIAVENRFYFLGHLLEGTWTLGFEIIVLSIPFALLLLILFFKSKLAYCVTLFIYSIVFIIELSSLIYHLRNCFRLFDGGTSYGSTPCGDLMTCCWVICLSALGFASMNTMILRNYYSWEILLTRYVFLCATILFLLYKIVIFVI